LQTLTPRRYLVLGVVALAAAFGDTFLAIGMKHLGPVSLTHPGELLTALQEPWVLSGVLVLLVWTGCYLTALSWADLTFVLPATSLAYVAVAFLSRFWLHEQISLARWAGIALITAGVGFVTQGPAYTPRDSVDPA
jgi:drug/metabolite transporter (DMT)-like permease